MKKFKFKVYRVYRDSTRKVTIEKNLTREEAIKLVNSFPSRKKSIVCFTAQY